MREIKLQDLKSKSPTELITFAEELQVENASTMRKQELMFAILKQLAAQETEIIGAGVVEVLQDGFGFLRSSDSNYLPGPDDIYISPSQIRRFGLRTGDTVDGPIRGPKEARWHSSGTCGASPALWWPTSGSVWSLSAPSSSRARRPGPAPAWTRLRRAIPSACAPTCR